jgi:hypothetical protein
VQLYQDLRATGAPEPTDYEQTMFYLQKLCIDPSSPTRFKEGFDKLLERQASREVKFPETLEEAHEWARTVDELSRAKANKFKGGDSFNSFYASGGNRRYDRGNRGGGGGGRKSSGGNNNNNKPHHNKGQNQNNNNNNSGGGGKSGNNDSNKGNGYAKGKQW